MSLALLLIVAGLVVALRGNDDGRTLGAARTGSTTTSDLKPVVVSTTAPVPTSTTTRKPTTTSKVIADDKEQHCASTAHADPEPAPDDWATYWQTKPNSNDPMALMICVDDITPSVGQLVTLTVTADDPDARIGDGDCDVNVTWDSNGGTLCRDVVIADNQPRPTPTEERGHVVKSFTHTYTAPGEPSVDVSAWSGPDDGHRHPYNSYANIELKLSVHAR